MQETKEKFYQNQIISDTIANLADKVSVYHSRLMTMERDFQKHLLGCTCEHAKNHEDIGNVKGEQTRRYVEEFNKKENAKAE
jgi:hypothetical protein